MLTLSTLTQLINTCNLTIMAVMGHSGHTSAGCLHVFQLIWKPQDGLIIPFTLFSQEMKKGRVLTDGFCVSQLEKKRKEKEKRRVFPSVIFLSDTQLGIQRVHTPTDLHQCGEPDQVNEHNAAFLYLTCF